VWPPATIGSSDLKNNSSVPQGTPSFLPRYITRLKRMFFPAPWSKYCWCFLKSSHITCIDQWFIQVKMTHPYILTMVCTSWQVQWITPEVKTSCIPIWSSRERWLSPDVTTVNVADDINPIYSMQSNDNLCILSLKK
jgi:hypothetical protein